MKRGTGFLGSLVILFFVLSLPGCQSKQEVISSEETTIEQIISKPAETSLAAIETSEIARESEALLVDGGCESVEEIDFSFADLSGLEFWFASGAGAWSTVIEIHPDGTFDGFYHDSNAGDWEEAYPNGTRYECYFSGKFTSLQKVGEYEYSMKCESLLEKGEPGDAEIIDGVLVVTAGSYGFELADEFLLYLPDRKMYGLPENFLMWVGINPDGIQPDQAGSEVEDKLSFYGLYNVGGETGFMAYPITESLETND